MKPTRKDYAVNQGYIFTRSFSWTGLNPAGVDFRFTVFGVGGADKILTVGDGITFDGVNPDWIVDLNTANLPAGSYQYSHDFKGSVGGWGQLSTGEFRIINPRVRP